ncbi:MAG: hypothetical protein ACTSW4_00080, partial [Candidatus Ranarchaeia archaeon]
MKFVQRRHLIMAFALMFCALSVVPSIAIAASTDGNVTPKHIFFVYIYDKTATANGHFVRIQIYHTYVYAAYRGTVVSVTWGPAFGGYSDTRSVHTYINGNSEDGYYSTVNVPPPGYTWTSP